MRKQFVPPPGGRMLGPSLSKLAATVGPYTSEQRENAVHIESTARYTLANEAAHEALRLKARTRTSDVFFVEAAEAREAAAAARAAKVLGVPCPPELPFVLVAAHLAVCAMGLPWALATAAAAGLAKATT